MRRIVGLTSILAGAASLAGCHEPRLASGAEDPFREQFLKTCQVYPDQVRIETQSGGRIKAVDYCACVYDTTVKDLSVAERKVAAFYLMSQCGASQEQLEPFKDMDLSAMGVASAAIVAAVERCPTR